MENAVFSPLQFPREVRRPKKRFSLSKVSVTNYRISGGPSLDELQRVSSTNPRLSELFGHLKQVGVGTGRRSSRGAARFQVNFDDINVSMSSSSGSEKENSTVAIEPIEDPEPVVEEPSDQEEEDEMEVEEPEMARESEQELMALEQFHHKKSLSTILERDYTDDDQDGDDDDEQEEDESDDEQEEVDAKDDEKEEEKDDEQEDESDDEQEEVDAKDEKEDEKDDHFEKSLSMILEQNSSNGEEEEEEEVNQIVATETTVVQEKEREEEKEEEEVAPPVKKVSKRRKLPPAIIEQPSPVHENVVVVEEEPKKVTMKRKSGVPINMTILEDGTRKSRRNRIAPLDYWRGQRPVYRRDSTGLGTFKIVSVEEGTKAWTPKVHKKSTTTTRTKRVVGAAGPAVEVIRERMNAFNLSIHESGLEKVKAKNEKTKKKLNNKDHFILGLEDLEWKPSKMSQGVDMAIAQRDESGAHGYIKFSAMSQKEKQKTSEYTTSFTVVFGVISVEIDDLTPVILQTGGFLRVKPGSFYSMKNLRNDEAIVQFYVIKH